MARIVLLQPPHRDTFGYSMPPVGLLHAAAGARAAGHEVRFLDFALMVRRGELPASTPADADRLAERCAERVAHERPDAVGIGAMLSSMPMALELAAALRRALPRAPLILGGQGPEQVEEAVLARHPAVDAVAVGEADETLAEWLDAACGPAPGTGRPARDVAAVPGLVVRGDGRPQRTPPRPQLLPLDRVPSPAWELCEPPSAYAAAAGQERAMFPIDLGRGCSFACSFCSTPGFWKRTARHLSPGRAADEFARLAELGAGSAYVTHDLFTFDRASVLAICAEKRRRGIGLPWECRTRLDLVDPELLAAMAAAGCTRILFGVESDSPAVLERVNKGGRAAALDVRAALADVEAAGIASILGTMAGVPGETAADLDRNLRLMAGCATRRGVSLSLHWFNVTPGNGQAGAVGAPLELLPGLFADLVRGHDLPAGHVPAAQRRLIAEDPELFAGFRVFAAAHATPRELFVLTRHAHLVLEVLPRTLLALAAETGRPLAALLLDALQPALDAQAAAPAALDAPPAALRSAHAAPGAADFMPDASRDEPLVLTRHAAVSAAGAFARQAGSGAVGTLARYEEALHGTLEPRLDRFAHDPQALVAAVDAGHWPPADPGGPVDTLCVRRGDSVRTYRLPPFIADVCAGLADDELARRWPELGSTGVAAHRAAAEQALHAITRGERATDCRPADAPHSPAPHALRSAADAPAP